MDAIVKATLEVPFWCSFRMPTAVNYHPTYPVPPITTVYGMIACAMGWPSDNYLEFENLKIGIAIVDSGDRIDAYSRIIKWDRRDKNMRTLLMRHKLLQPVYQIFVKGEKILIENIAKALVEPFFPLYLGESDDIVEIKDVKVFPVQKVSTLKVNSILPQEMGRPINKVELVHLPVGFLAEELCKKRVWSGVNYQGYYIAEEIILDTPVEAYQLGEMRVVM